MIWVVHVWCACIAAASSWSHSRRVAIPLVAVSLATVAAEHVNGWPWGLLWQIVGPVGLLGGAWACWRPQGARAVVGRAVILGAFALGWFGLLAAMQTRFALGLALGAIHALALAACACAVRFTRVTKVERRLLAWLAISAATSSAGAILWGAECSMTPALIADLWLMTAVVITSFRWTRPPLTWSSSRSASAPAL